MKRFIIIICAPLLFSLFSFSHERISYPSVMKIHPPTVHFAIALPLFALLLEGYYLLRRRNPDDIEFFTLFLSTGGVVLASTTGYIAHESVEELLVESEILDLLHTHETIGLSLAVLLSLTFLLRVLYRFRPSKTLRFAYLILLLIGVITILIQGNIGGRLVYDLGLGVSK